MLHESEYKGSGHETWLTNCDGVEAIRKVGGISVEREHVILSALSGTAIPKVIRYATRDDHNEMIIEKKHGEPLGERICLQPGTWISNIQSVESQKMICRGLAGAFSDMIASGYIYRDLNLNHIIVSNDNEVGLVDYEWSVRIRSDGRAVVDSRSGTWETMAPEEFRMTQLMTEASSVFTLGTVLHQLAYGRSPFVQDAVAIPDPTKRRAATLRAMKMSTFSTVSGLDRLLGSALEYRMSHRMQTIHEFINALDDIAS